MGDSDWVPVLEADVRLIKVHIELVGIDTRLSFGAID